MNKQQHDDKAAPHAQPTAVPTPAAPTVDHDKELADLTKRRDAARFANDGPLADKLHEEIGAHEAKHKGSKK